MGEYPERLILFCAKILSSWLKNEVGTDLEKGVGVMEKTQKAMNEMLRQTQRFFPNRTNNPINKEIPTMTLVRYNPSITLPRLSKTFDEMFKSFFDEHDEMHPQWRPAMDVQDTGKEYIATFMLPGFEKNDINVSFKKNTLVVKAERKDESQAEKSEYLVKEISRGSYLRSIELPDDVDTEKINADYTAGILTLTLPKSKQEVAREITINVK